MITNIFEDFEGMIKIILMGAAVAFLDDVEGADLWEDNL